MGVDKGKGLSENVSSSGDFLFRAGPSLTRDSAMTPSSSHVPFLSRRYPLRMPLRYGCALFGCSLPVPTSEKRYCCESHELIATQMDATSGACIFFDGLKTVDVSLCTALLHRTRGGTAVGIPTSPESIFAVLPWELGPEFHPQPLPGEACRSWAFFCKDPVDPPKKIYPTMGRLGTSPILPYGCLPVLPDSKCIQINSYAICSSKGGQWITGYV
ncbi:unnamed protein product [Arabidopsis halleri]